MQVHTGNWESLLTCPPHYFNLTRLDSECALPSWLVSLVRYSLSEYVWVFLVAWSNNYYNWDFIPNTISTLTTLSNEDNLFNTSRIKLSLYRHYHFWEEIIQHLKPISHQLLMCEDPVRISFLSHQEQREALTKSSALKTLSWTVKQEQYCHYEWGLDYTMPAASYKITGDSPT